MSNTHSERCHAERIDYLTAFSYPVAHVHTLHLPRRRPFDVKNALDANIHTQAEFLHRRIEQRANTCIAQVVQYLIDIRRWTRGEGRLGCFPMGTESTHFKFLINA